MPDYSRPMPDSGPASDLVAGLNTKRVPRLTAARSNPTLKLSFPQTAVLLEPLFVFGIIFELRLTITLVNSLPIPQSRALRMRLTHMHIRLISMTWYMIEAGHPKPLQASRRASDSVECMATRGRNELNPWFLWRYQKYPR